MKAIYTNLCPNCGGEISSDRLEKGLPCRNCLKDDAELDYKGIYKKLKENKTIKNYETVFHVLSSLEDFCSLFEDKVGAKPWSIQRVWAKRFFLGRSFSIVAPTGVGKTTFGIILALYLAKKGKKTYFVLPTTTLIEQVRKKIEEFGGNVACVHSKMSKKEREENMEKIKEGVFDVLVTSSQFLSKNFEILKGINFSLIFIDDVDALLRASKNIDRVLMLSGFSEDDIRIGMEVIRAQRLAAMGRESFEKVEELRSKIKGVPKAQVIIASATGRARGLRVKLFRELLGFEVGATRAGLRNVVNIYADPGKIGVKELVRKLGDGGLIFVPVELGKERAAEIAEALRQEGIKAEVATSENAVKVLPLFEKGEIDVLVGVATYYGVLVRGIDMPERIKYAVFTGVPRFRFKIDLSDAPKGMLAFLLDGIAAVKKDPSYRELSTKLRRDEKYLEEARRAVAKALDEETVALLEKKGIAHIRENYMYIADVRTYIQASGRTSRMYAGGITKGISIVLVDIPPVFKQLERMLSVYDEFFEEFDEEKLEKIIKEVELERKALKEKKIPEDPVKNILFIVESPNKARTIASFFGRPSKHKIGPITAYEATTGKYVVTIAATLGHMFDLVVDRGFHGVEGLTPVYTSIKKCRKCGVQTVMDKCPHCDSEEFLDDALWRVNALRVLALEADNVIIGTDPDTEGEKIAWDVFLALKPYCQKIFRSEFHEVTRGAILEALEGRDSINRNRVDAQIVRRIEDRWIGFELSRKLWEKFGSKTLSAGRVQTPVLGWIIERYEEHKESISEFTRVYFDGKSITFEGVSNSEKIIFKLVSKEKKEISPLPPFTTDSMLKEACNTLNLGANEVMALAQDLFESGLITYHRTDSTRVSSAGITIAKQYITEIFGEEYFSPRNWGEGGAHECIRPVRPIDVGTLIRYIREGLLNVRLTPNHFKLYSLIFDRFIRSQMAKALVVEGVFKAVFGDLEEEIRGYIDILFPGFLAGKRVDVLKEGVFAVRRVFPFKAAKIPLYSQADVVALMKERGIGRPSTYAVIISKLLDRKYVLESKSKRKLYPTKLGIKVYSFLSENFAPLVSEERTRELEEIMDKIEEGTLKAEDILNQVYNELNKVLKVL